MNGNNIKLHWRHNTTISIYSEKVNLTEKQENQKNEAQNSEISFSQGS